MELTNEELKQQLFKLSFALDSQSAEKDYVALRNTHYQNQKWIHNKGLQEEYYQYFLTKIKGDNNMSRLIDADNLVLEHEIDIQRLSEAPTVKAVSIEQLEEMYEKYRKYLWRNSDNVRGDDMIEIGYAEQYLQDLLSEFGCWDRKDEE